jgi:predicted RNase H-like HicB family nuclease
MSKDKILDKDIKYEMVVFWSEEDEAFVVEVPELPGCMADGRTYEEAIKNTLAVIREWIETAKEPGREIPYGSLKDSGTQGIP